MTLEERLSVDDFPRVKAWKDKGQFATVNGVELFYVSTPDFGTRTSKKPNLLVLHGYPTCSYDFYKVWDDLVANFEVFIYDFAGYGFSQKVYTTIPAQIDLLEGLLQKSMGSDLEKLKIHIFSHDLGDTLMQEILARRENGCNGDSSNFNVWKQGIQSVVALNGGMFPGMHRPTMVQKLLVTPVIGYLLAMMSFSISTFQSSLNKVFGPDTKPSDEEVSELYALLLCNNGSELVSQNIRYMNERVQHKERWTGALERYARDDKQPFLFINGPADPVSGQHLADYIVEVMQDTNIVIRLEDKIGHWPQLEAPKETMEALLNFHRELGSFM